MNDKEQNSRLRSKMDGVMVGIVTNTKDPEGLARVKLKLPLLDENKETDWVRIATLFAGADRGSLFVPMVGDEVLVAFHMGEIQMPYIIGCLWSKKHKGPPPNEENKLRGLKTAAGHELMFDDDPGAGRITIQTGKGRKILLEEEGEKITLTPGGGNRIEIIGGDSPEIQLQIGSSTITVGSTGEITLSGQQTVRIKAPKLSFEAEAGIDIVSKGVLSLKSGSTVVIEAAMVKIN